MTPTPSSLPKVLPHKWGAYCRTNGRRTAVQMGGVLRGFPFLRSSEARKVRRYKWGAYCRTNWRCTAVLFRQVVGVGVSETLPLFESGKKKQHKHKLFGPDFPRTFLTHTPGCPRVKKFLPTTGAAEKRTFWCGRPRFSARTSMTRRIAEKLCTKKVCVDFLAALKHCPFSKLLFNRNGSAL